MASRSWACSVPAHLLPHTDSSPDEEFLGRAFHRQRGNGDEGARGDGGERGGVREPPTSPSSPAQGRVQPPPAGTQHRRTHPRAGSPASGPARAHADSRLSGSPALLGRWRCPAWSRRWGFPAWSERGLPATAAATAGAADAEEAAG